MKKYLTALFLAVLLTATAAVSAQTQVGNATYTVQPGDTLYRIGLKFNIAPNTLANANGVVNPNLIYVGQRLILPGVAAIITPAATSATMAATATTSSSATMAASAAATVSNTTGAINTPAAYAVQPGDNLYRIASKFNTTIFILSQLNGLSNANLIYVGQILRLPVVGLAASATSMATASSGSTAPATMMATAAPTSALTTSAAPTMMATGSPLATAVVPTTSAATNAVASLVPTSAAIATVVVPATTAAPNVAPTSAPVNVPTQAAAVSSNVGFAVGVVINNAQDSTAVTQSATDLGATWVKQIASWRTIEATQGSPDYSALDSAVNAYNAAGLKVLLTLTNAPDWARTTPQEDGPPTDFGTFATFATNIATHYKGKVQAYEIWNEPNLRRNWNGRPLSAASYVEMLRRAYAAIKGVDGGALVISAGLSPTGFNDGVNAVDDRLFLRQAYIAGLAVDADAIGAHPNGWANPPDSTCCQASPGVTGWFNNRSFYFRDTLNDYRQIMKDRGDSNKFIWVTAFGWGANEGVAADNTVSETSFGFVKFTSKAKQAQYVTRGFQIGRELSFVGPMFLDNLNACQSVSGAASAQFYQCYYSLLDASGKPRPAFDAIKALKK